MTEPLDLDALAALEAAATPGPWEGVGFRIVTKDNLRRTVALCGPGVIADADADLIAAARNALPALIERVRELEHANDELSGALIRSRDARIAAEADRDAYRARIDAVRALCDDFGTDDGAAQDFRDGIYAALDGDT